MHDWVHVGRFCCGILSRKVIRVTRLQLHPNNEGPNLENLKHSSFYRRVSIADAYAIWSCSIALFMFNFFFPRNPFIQTWSQSFSSRHVLQKRDTSRGRLGIVYHYWQLGCTCRPLNFDQDSRSSPAYFYPISLSNRPSLKEVSIGNMDRTAAASLEPRQLIRSTTHRDTAWGSSTGAGEFVKCVCVQVRILFERDHEAAGQPRRGRPGTGSLFF